jgi:hypothetical protein
MTGTRSFSCSARRRARGLRAGWRRWWANGFATLAVTAIAGMATPAPSAAQDGLDAACAGSTAASPPACLLSASAVRLVHPRVGLALFGGSPVPGSASTLGMRLGSMPRMSLSSRLVLVPMEVPPLADGSGGGDRGLAIAMAGQATVGILPGFTPLPTVGGVLSLDAIGRIGWVRLPGDVGFQDQGVWGASAGLRIGALRESFTLPGVSLTASYGRSGTVELGDPAAGTTEGFASGAVGRWSATLSASKRLFAAGLGLGVSWDRYSSTVDLGYRTSPLGPQVRLEGVEADTDLWSAYADLSWTLLIFHAAVEVGWQEGVDPVGLPTGVDVDPANLWAAIAFRVSI